MVYRSRENRVFGGVCGGIAKATDLNATGLRWAVVLFTLFLSGTPVVVYLVLWLLLNEEPLRGGAPFPGRGSGRN